MQEDVPVTIEEDVPRPYERERDFIIKSLNMLVRDTVDLAARVKVLEQLVETQADLGRKFLEENKTK